MPCLILTGHPCAGKSTFARLLAERALIHPSSNIKSVAIVNEESARPDKTKKQCYESALEEKMTRMALKAEFDRQCSSCKLADGGAGRRSSSSSNSSSKLVILDSMNYIKGYRYELHCISKSAGELHGIIWCLNDPEVAKRWNQNRRQRKQQDGNGGDKKGDDEFHTDKTMDELIMRYEPPDERNRWDKPLYTVSIKPTLDDLSATTPLEDGTKDEKIDAGSATKSSSVATAEATMKRTVYDMHSLSQTIVEGGETKDESSKPKKNFVGFSKKSSSGFKRATKKQPSAATEQRPKPKKQFATLTDSALAVMNSSFGMEKTEGSENDNDSTNNNDDNIKHEDSLFTKKHPTARTKMAKEDEKGEKTIEERIDDILTSFLTETRPLKEGLSTSLNVTAEANVLHEVDNIIQRVTSAFVTAQKTASIAPGVGGTITIPLQGKNKTVELKRAVHLPELRRLRRQYIKWITNHPPEDTTEWGIASSFLSYVETQL